MSSPKAAAVSDNDHFVLTTTPKRDALYGGEPEKVRCLTLFHARAWPRVLVHADENY